MENDLLIIYYHEVVSEGQGYSYQKTTLDKFDHEMKYLSENGYHSLLFSELTEPIPDKSIIVSFDDGFRSVYDNAAPIMRKYGIKGNVYLPTSFLDRDPHFMTWSMAQELTNSGQFEMQAHTHTHADIRTLSDQQVKDEIAFSDRLFHEKLGYFPQAFCFPFGVWNWNSVKLLRSMKRYSFFLGSHYGRVSPSRLSCGVLPRIGISDDDTMEVFSKKLDGAFDWKGPLQLCRLALHNLRGDRITEYTY